MSVEAPQAQLVKIRPKVSQTREALYGKAVFESPDSNPLVQFIVKIAGRCNINCDYCYMYEKYDQSWREKPRFMSEETTRIVAKRINQHVLTHRDRGFERVGVVLHGGEPLMAGPERIKRFIDIMRSEIVSTRVDFGLQTNGVLLDDEMAALLKQLEIGVGISLDGDRQAQDRHRLTHRGKSSHEKTEAAVRLLQKPEYAGVAGGVLAVMDLRNDPDALYEYFLELGVKGFSFLLPEATWDDPPPGKDIRDGSAPYADWLIRVFDRWFDEPTGHRPMPMFDTLLSLLLGGPGKYEVLGLGAQSLIVIETDGSIVSNESIRAAYPGAAESNINLADNTFEDVLSLPSMVFAQNTRKALSDTCQRCEVVQVCGSGDPYHRYKSGSGFKNPSVYCTDLFELISHADGRVRNRLESYNTKSDYEQADQENRKVKSSNG